MHTSPPDSLEVAVSALRRGGVVVYPTEAVWGLGCDPFREPAVMRLLAIKQREVDKGLILIAGSLEQFEGLLDWSQLDATQYGDVVGTWPGPSTWVVPATARVPRWITGNHAGVAVRVSSHPQVAALASDCGFPLVSTSANFAGKPPAFARGQLDAALLAAVNAVAPGETGGNPAPSSIRDAITGEVLRA
ncbi:MAG: Sua5/YciO/YrdC/YwlC family protein [Pseudomonadota bacterium]|nr:Sua5/YciO/YrdC/YwlC family protein [Pseudomonadota bacterium]